MLRPCLMRPLLLVAMLDWAVGQHGENTNIGGTEIYARHYHP